MNQLEQSTRKYLYAHTSQETAYVVEDYPWGFRLRTTIRYWIETKKAKNGGQRFASQTINPKTGVWCAPKYSTYSPIIVMYLNEDDHIKWHSLSFYSSKEYVEAFKNEHVEKLDDFQKEKLKDMIAVNNVMQHVTVTFKAVDTLGPVSLLSKDPEQIAKREAIIKEQEERKEERKKSEQMILNAICHERNKIVI